MTNLRQAAQQALEAWFRPHGINYVDFKPYMEALRAALAEPEQEPVLEVRCFGEKRVFVTLVPVEQLKDGEKLYRSLSQEKPVGYFRLEQGIWYQYHEDDAHPETLTPLYTAPTPRKPQTTHWEGCEAVHPECKEKNT